MALKVTQEPTEDRQLALTVEVDQERIDKELRKAARKAASQYRIPGFRKGKAPYSVIVKQVGLPTLYNEFIDDLGQEIFKEAIEQEKIEPYAMANLTDVEFEPVRYKLLVPLDPEIDLGDYRSLRVAETTPTVDEEAFQKRLAEHLGQYAEWQNVTRPIENGDLVTLDVKSVLTEPNEGEEESIVLDETDWEITLDEEYPMDPPGLDDQILGAKVGDEKKFTLSWPEDSQSMYAGKSANFEIKIRAAKSYEQPELTDELAQMIGPDFETAADLKKSIEDTLLEEASTQAENEYMDKVLDSLLERSTLVYPPVVIDDQINAMINDMEMQLRRAGIEDPQNYFENMGMNMDDFREGQREEAKKIAERNLLLSEIITKEGLVVEDDDIDERIGEIVGNTGEQDPEQAENMKAMFREGQMRQMLDSQILTTKAVARLKDIAIGNEIPDAKPLSKRAATKGQPEDEKTESAANSAEKADDTEIDFTKINGIGKTFDERLKEADITSYAALAEMTAEQIGEIIGWSAERVENDDIIAQAVELAK